jgi:uncharacterized membrane protein (UPF0127 family)
MAPLARIALTAIASLVVAMCACSCGKSKPPPGTVTLCGRTWKVELAMDEASRYLGLSDRVKMPDDAGMLFIYPTAQPLSFCMRNCFIPLDIVFLDAGGKVVRTYTMPTEPRGHEVAEYPSLDPAVYAMELNAGELKKAGVKIGDQAVFNSIPDPAQAKP